MPLVLLMRYDAQARFSKGPQHFLCVVRGCVIYGDDFKFVAAFLPQNAAQAVWQVLRVVVARYNKRYQRNGRCQVGQELSQSIAVSLMTRAGTPTAVTPSGKL